MPQRIPDGWWSLAGVQGSTTGVLKAIGNSQIPDPAKRYLTELVNAIDAKYNFVSLDAHFNVDNATGRTHLALTLVPSAKLLG